jgi:hypothetical protein
MHSLQDFAKYKKVALKKPTVTQWIPDIPSLVLGAVLGSAFTFAAFSKINIAQISNVPATNELVVEQAQEKSMKFEFYGVLKNGE